MTPPVALQKIIDRVDAVLGETSRLLEPRHVQLFFLVFCGVLLFLGRINEIGLANDADAWYAQKAWEMLRTGSYMIVYYLGAPSFINPPFPIWLQALSLKLFGETSAFAAVLPSALMALATVVLTYRIVEKLFGNRWVAFLSGMILIFPGFYLDNARRAQVDVPLTFLILAVLYCGLKAEKNPKWYLVGGLLTGFGILTKSVMGLFPLIILFVYLLMTGQGRRMLGGYAFLGVVLALGVGGSWFVIGYLEFPEQFVNEQFKQNLMSRSQAANTGWYFLGYVHQLFKNYWPWFPFAVGGAVLFARRYWKERDRACLLVLLWAGVIIGIMSLSRGQTFHYILGAFPPLAILSASAIDHWTSSLWKHRVGAACAGVIVLTVVMVAATPVEIRSAVSLSKNHPELRALAPVIAANVAPGERIRNYNVLDASIGRVHTLYFYSKRILNYTGPVKPQALLNSLQKEPQHFWMTPTPVFRDFARAHPNTAYLVQGNETMSFFTSWKNRDRVVYVTALK